MKMALSKPIKRLTTMLWSDHHVNDLWQRIVKCTIACTVAVIIVIRPEAVAVFGPSTFLAPMTTVFAHPGQRMDVMIEALLMILLGALTGLAWSLLGLFLSSLVVDNPPAAYAIRAVFLLASVLVHGYVRCSSPRLFTYVAFLLIASIIVLLGNSKEVTLSVFTNVYYPLLAGGGVVLVVNSSMFPELSSSFLGLSTIDTLCETMDTLTRATAWFVTPGGDCERPMESIHGINTRSTAFTALSAPEKPGHRKRKSWFRKLLKEFPNPFRPGQSRFRVSSVLPQMTTVANLTARKTKLRTRLARCRAAQKEVNFEISFSPLPPSSMKPLSTSLMTNLVQSTITLIGACENKFIVLENDARSIGDDLTTIDTLDSELAEMKRMSTAEDYLRKMENAKPMREIEASSASLLESIVTRIREPVEDFDASLKEAVVLVVSCIAYCYDVPRLPSGAPAPTGIHLQELDLRIDHFTNALSIFDSRCAEELRRTAMDESGLSSHFMPRMETFLISSFVLGFRQAAMHVLEMLRHVRQVVEQRKAKNDRSSIWLPRHTSIRQWLTTPGESDAMVLPQTARKQARRGEDAPKMKTKSHDDSVSKETLVQPNPGDTETGLEENTSEARPVRKVASKKPESDESKDGNWVTKLRGTIADTLEWLQDSDDIAYALKLAIAVFSVSWPALVKSWNPWYTEVRGIWAPLQLILVFEVAIGTSFFIFFIRLLGVVFGCVVGFLSYEIGRGNRIAMVVILVFGIIPSFYIQLGTKYVKAGMISTVSMVVVALAAMNGNGTSYENFYKRLSAFLIGGLVALTVELFIYPVRARDRLLESLSASVRHIQNMQATMAVGIDGPVKADFKSPILYRRFNLARGKARGALAAAETFLPFCSTEPRLKGSFKPLAPIYREIVYVLHQIIDRMDNMVQLRKEYGSSVIEDLNHKVHAYRRNAVASIMLVLFSVNEALTTWQPLPQFIPSSRLAQLRLVNHVREVLASRSGTQTPAGGVPTVFDEHGELDEQIAYLVTQKRFLSWNAATAGQLEIIEYLEELVELVKLLVGVNAFRSGLLEKPDYVNYRQRIQMDRVPLVNVPTVETETGIPAEEVVTAPAAFPPHGDVDAGLQRTTTMRERAGQFRKRLRGRKDEEVIEAETDSDDDIPTSLQRVGTRLWENDAVVRRRRVTLSHEPGYK
ncbi:hypothetical protein G7046_g5169 [Stylonectria norvegica]|nr:hypothetical protein G7046_g5169 [Stylonectria norvegica]